MLREGRIGESLNDSSPMGENMDDLGKIPALHEKSSTREAFDIKCKVNNEIK